MTFSNRKCSADLTARSWSDNTSWRVGSRKTVTSSAVHIIISYSLKDKCGLKSLILMYQMDERVTMTILSLWPEKNHIPGMVTNIYNCLFTDSPGNIDPSLVEKQKQLKRARIADAISDHLCQRPGPLELVKANILHTTEDLEKAVKGKCSLWSHIHCQYLCIYTVNTAFGISELVSSFFYLIQIKCIVTVCVICIYSSYRGAVDVQEHVWRRT